MQIWAWRSDQCDLGRKSQIIVTSLESPMIVCLFLMHVLIPILCQCRFGICKLLLFPSSCTLKFTIFAFSRLNSYGPYLIAYSRPD